MTAPSSIPPKPVSQVVRPEITRLPPITPWRRFWRGFWRLFTRLLSRLLARVQVRGLEHFPRQGGVLVVSNHLGDADFALGVAFAPRPLDFLAKSEGYDIPVLGALLRAYGVIWIHRGQPDRRALRAGLQALAQGRALAIAPEGRESLSGALEEGTQGAAYLALKSGAPVLPVTFTGSENARLRDHLRRLRRAPMTITIGPPFRLEPGADRKTAVERGTQTIMRRLAQQLPPQYRGVYQTEAQESHERG